MTTGELQTRTKQFALRIIRLSQALPRSAEARVIGNQILRSGTSVGANYRAACRSKSRADFIAKLGTVVEEIDETQFWLDLLADSKLVPEARLKDLRGEAGELAAIFTASRATAKSHA